MLVQAIPCVQQNDCIVKDDCGEILCTITMWYILKARGVTMFEGSSATAKVKG